MRSCLPKNLEDAISPVFTKAVKDREYDAIYALHVDEADHRSSAQAYLHKAAFDDIGGPHPNRALKEQTTATFKEIRQASGR